MRALRYAGPVAVLWAWVVVLVSSAANPTFSVLRSPLSAMGSPGAIDPWIYNVGMMTVGSLILLYGLSLGAGMRHWVQGFASGLFGTAGIFLALVGIYPRWDHPARLRLPLVLPAGRAGLDRLGRGGTFGRLPPRAGVHPAGAERARRCPADPVAFQRPGGVLRGTGDRRVRPADVLGVPAPGGRHLEDARAAPPHPLRADPPLPRRGGKCSVWRLPSWPRPDRGASRWRHP